MLKLNGREHVLYSILQGIIITMPSFLSLSENHLAQLKEDGVIILPNMISSDIVNDIRKDTLSWYKNISFNNRISSSIIGNNQWIDHVGLCSFKALKLVLDANLIKFLKKYFNSDISLGNLADVKCAFSTISVDT